MAELDRIVDITITRQSVAIATASFEIPLVLTEHTAFPERSRIYTDMDAVAEDFDSTDEAYKIAQKLFGQSTVGAVPAQIVMGRKVASESWVEALDAVSNVNNEWYALVAGTHEVADVMALATAIQSRRKIFGTSTQDSNFTGETHIGKQLDDDSLGRTFWVYTADADDDYPEAAIIGAQLPYTPGSNDWDFKRVTGVTVSNVSDNQRAQIRAINGNMYTTVAGVNIFQDGNMADGSPIDEVVFVDWLYARLQEAIFFRLINSLKVPMTNPGLNMIENEIRTVLAQAVQNNGIDRGYTVTVPDVLDIPETMRAQRTAGTFVFRARLAGSIRRVQLNGFLSV